MKKILILTAKALHEYIDFICLILQKKYLHKHGVETLESMKEGEIFDYVYLIISDITSEAEKSSLVIQARLWTQSDTSMIPIKFETITNCEEKIKRREENKLRRKENLSKRTSPSISMNQAYSILTHKN